MKVAQMIEVLSTFDGDDDIVVETEYGQTRDIDFIDMDYCINAVMIKLQSV